MAEVVIRVRNDRNRKHRDFVLSVLEGVMTELLSILIPKPKVPYTEKWYRSVETGRWVKVWVPKR